MTFQNFEFSVPANGHPAKFVIDGHEIRDITKFEIVGGADEVTHVRLEFFANVSASAAAVLEGEKA